MRIYVTAVMIAALYFYASSGAEARVAIRIDTEPAQAVLAAIRSSPDQVNAMANRAIQVPAIRAMLAKEHKYNDKASEDSFRAALISIARGGTDETFQLGAVRKEADKINGLLRQLQTNESALEKQLSDRLESFAPADLDLKASLVVVLGSHQNGWVPDQKTPIFYLDAVFQHGDVDGLLATAAHELFHVVQGAVQPDWGPAMSPLKDSSAKSQTFHNVHAALLNLVIEGMADYVGDPNAFAGTGSGITQARNEYARNSRRLGECFALFDTILFRLARDPQAPLNSMLDIGFGGAWDQTGYYVGYAMAKTIDSYRGHTRLQELVRLTPEEFVTDYISLSREHRDSAKVVPLAESTVEAVEESRRQEEKTSPQ